MKAIRIREETYEFLLKLSRQEKRSLVSTLDLFVELFKEVGNEEMAGESVSSSVSAKIKNKKQALASIAAKGIQER